MSYLEYAHLPSGRRSRLASLSERGHGRIALLTLDPTPLTHPASPAAGNDAADPHHAFRLAAEAGFSAITTPIGLAETYHPDYAEFLPLVLDLNPDIHRRGTPILTASIEDALRLDARAVAFTLDERDDAREQSLAQFQQVRSQAHRYALPVLLRARAPQPGDAPSADRALALACAAAALGADLAEIALPTPADIEGPNAGPALLEALRAACATPVLLNLDASADPTQATQHARAALDAGCAGITASHTLWNRNYRDALHLAGRLRDQLTA